MTTPPIAYASAPPDDGRPCRGLWIGAIVYAAAVVVRHATFWGRSFLTDQRPSPAAALALAEMATLVALIAFLIGHRERRAGVQACAIALLGMGVLGVLLDVVATPVRLDAINLLRFVWMLASRAQFFAIPIALLIASRGAVPVVRQAGEQPITY